MKTMDAFDIFQAPKSSCDEFASPNIPNFILSVTVLVGILISYLPQHVRIVSRRSSEGLSPYFVMLGTISASCALGNILVLPASQNAVSCCSAIGGLACASALLGIAQIAIQWCCFFVIMLLFIIFFPKIDTSEGSTLDSPFEAHPHRWQDAVITVGVAMGHFIITFIISIVIFARYPSALQLWANLLGGLSAILAIMQYFPQIWTTWKLKAAKSLSIPMMLIQTPGAFVFATSLALRYGLQGWSVWGVFIVTGCLQGCLLAMAIIFELQNRRDSNGPRDASMQSERDPSERTPLLDSPTSLENSGRAVRGH
ncbi:PQ loop repeat protein [Eremomyces bilateralis CBS 781.70]|uniref:PQ loop repeat protein n=1 Tax=Eremomyces bilateralis CBS 781.70 TaxID=1392243 RepID=A0A6G1G7T6_9PEZI|nr:PQ loop repeat protein [Eremomyces bilateralis CBS 781.70]KAF1814137.1 PQ loop repeat protein [Eremomyces bilateralis CBS 781.70]